LKQRPCFRRKKLVGQNWEGRNTTCEAEIMEATYFHGVIPVSFKIHIRMPRYICFTRTKYFIIEILTNRKIYRGENGR
jgi:hypothetical protein